MSAFFFDDTCAVKEDLSIVGTVEASWSDVDNELPEGLTECEKSYIHKDLPSHVRNAFFENKRLAPGFVVMAFMQHYDGYCLIAEDSLQLIDRSLAVGDVVKRSPSDAQSGTVISTSLMCGLQPLCTESGYKAKKSVPAQGHTPSHGPHALKYRSQRDRLLHGFPHSTESLPISPTNVLPRPPSLQVPAQELTYWNKYREEDFVIYRDWIGQVDQVYDEVTVRLTNGSVVVVEDPEELEESCWVPGTRSHELVQRLDRAGYYRYNPSKRISDVGKPRLFPAESSYPGQYVLTKKGNLRRGRWKFGAYDPTILPEGIVVDVRCIQLEVQWLYPNQSLPLREQASPPAGLLDTDELESGEVLVYDRSRLPKNPASDQLSDASYSPDTGFGHRARFRDPAGAAVKYSQTPVDPEITGSSATSTGESRATPRLFNRIPRSATQGFDMNVLQVASTSTQAMIRWQDCSVTEENSICLHPYLNPDEHDVWPGDRVSFTPAEERLDGNGPNSIRAHRLGVVQSVNAAGRIARVRWYLNAKIDMDEDKTWQSYGSTYGALGSEITELPLYDIAAHPALLTHRGDLAIILPESVPSLCTGQAVGSSILRMLRPLGLAPHSSDPASEADRTSLEPPFVNQPGGSSPLEIEWFGEIIDLSLDGGVIVRLGAAHEARDIEVPDERILEIASGDLDSNSDNTDDMDQDSVWSDEMPVSPADTNLDADRESLIDVSFEYEDGKKLDADNDEEIWATDEEEEDSKDPDNQMPDQSDDPFLAITSPIGTMAREPPYGSISDRAVSYSGYPSMPLQFSILDGHTPTDHHFLHTVTPLTAGLMRRIVKENEIMRKSLPDGVFVRSWDTRLDLLRVLIVGPYDTPYEFAPFVIDLQFGASFPTSAPDAFFHSWTNNVGRINPNLYEDGKICLSLLGTWDGDNRNEEWSSKKSTVLQLLVSLMGLVLVKEPYYNEAGFDVLIGSEESRVPSALYREKVYVMSKGFIRTAISTTPQGLEDIVEWLYLSSKTKGPRLLQRVLEDSRAMLLETTATEVTTESLMSRSEAAKTPTRLSAGALILLRRNLQWLEEYLEREEVRTTETAPDETVHDTTVP